MAPPSSSECADANGLNTPLSVALSPDGKSLYATSENLDAVSAFSRNTTTGVLTQLSDEAGCVAENSASVPPCADGEALGSPQSIALSPDGKSLYVASEGSNAVAVFSRNTNTGALTQLADPEGLRHRRH
jgi:6-phosphogluconolactonase (cycloisomerase 2 family)